MNSPRLSQFQADLGRARDMVGLGQSIGAMTHGRVDSSDIYRAGLVQAVAALDHYVHGVVLDRATSILLGRISGGGGTKVGLPFSAVAEILNVQMTASVELTIRSHLAQRLSLETYQRPDDVGAALAMVGIPRIWKVAFVNAELTKKSLSLVVQRRNRIVHQCDSDPLTPGSVTVLLAEDAINAIEVVNFIVSTIDFHY